MLTLFLSVVPPLVRLSETERWKTGVHNKQRMRSQHSRQTRDRFHTKEIGGLVSSRSSTSALQLRSTSIDTLDNRMLLDHLATAVCCACRPIPRHTGIPVLLRTSKYHTCLYDTPYDRLVCCLKKRNTSQIRHKKAVIFSEIETPTKVTCLSNARCVYRSSCMRNTPVLRTPVWYMVPGI